jgi:hypothetical protein
MGRAHIRKMTELRVGAMGAFSAADSDEAEDAAALGRDRPPRRPTGGPLA